MRILGYGMALVREQTAAVERAESRLNGEVVLFRRNVSPLWQARAAAGSEKAPAIVSKGPRRANSARPICK